MRRTWLKGITMLILLLCGLSGWGQDAETLMKCAYVDGAQGVLSLQELPDGSPLRLFAPQNAAGVELLRYSDPEAPALNVAGCRLLEELLKAEMSCVRLSAAYRPEEPTLGVTMGWDALLVVKLKSPLNREAFLAQLPAFEEFIGKPRQKALGNDLQVQFKAAGMIPLELDLLAGDRVLLLGQPLTLSRVRGGKAPEPAVSQVENGHFNMVLMQTAETEVILEEKLEEVPEPFKSLLQGLAAVRLTARSEELVEITLEMECNEADVAQALFGFASQGKLWLKAQTKEYETLSDYVSRMKAEVADKTCRVKLVLPSSTAAVLPVGAAVLLPALSKARGKAQQVSCVNNLKQIALAMFMYADDHEDQFPAQADWEKNLKDYIGNEKVLICPAVNKRIYIYALDGTKQDALEEPSRTILVYEDPREIGHGKKIAVAFADGHVETVDRGDLTDIHEIAQRENFILWQAGQAAPAAKPAKVPAPIPAE